MPAQKKPDDRQFHVGDKVRVNLSSPWFWIGFLGTLAAILLAAMFWLALHRPAS